MWRHTHKRWEDSFANQIYCRDDRPASATERLRRRSDPCRANRCAAAAAPTAVPDAPAATTAPAAEAAAPAATAEPAPTAEAAATAEPAATAAGTSEGAFQIPEIEEGKFNIAMVLIGPHDDLGWSQAHYEGLEYVATNVPNTHIAYIENVPEGADPSRCSAASRKGFNLIPGTSFGYMDPMELVAEGSPTSPMSISAAISRTTATSATCSARWRT